MVRYAPVQYSEVRLKNRAPISAFRIISLSLLLLAFILTTLQLIRFSRVRAYLPDGLKIAGVNVGGLDRQQAAQRLLEAYTVPVELRYKDSIIQVSPSLVDFQLDLESMLAEADSQRTSTLFWQEFWDYLWGRTTTPREVPLSASYSEARLRTYLTDIAVRYDQPASPPLPITGSVEFKPGTPGTSLDVEPTVAIVEKALYSLQKRDLDIPLKRTNPSRPTFDNIEILLKQTLDGSDFDGLAGIYMKDLQTGQEIHFARQNKQDVPVEPDIAFAASSIIKIPVMVSAYRRMGDNPDAETLGLIEKMIDKSGNEDADWLMDRVIDGNRGPLVVTEDMQTLGLENTFLAGYFAAGSSLLARIETPANTRTDINTNPDLYNQTTPSDIGMLLDDLYQCAQTGGGSLPAVFPGEITQRECQEMNRFLLNNRLPVLFTAGLPEGTQIAHKHGWSGNNGVINTIQDAGIIYSLGGNYILAIFMYNPNQLVWDPTSELVAILSRAVYNYYNAPLQ